MNTLFNFSAANWWALAFVWGGVGILVTVLSLDRPTQQTRVLLTVTLLVVMLVGWWPLAIFADQVGGWTGGMITFGWFVVSSLEILLAATWVPGDSPLRAARTTTTRSAPSAQPAAQAPAAPPPPRPGSTFVSPGKPGRRRLQFAAVSDWRPPRPHRRR